MIHLDVAQGSPEWVRARIGIPTASCFDKIITPAKLEFSKSSEPYAWQLIAEEVLSAPMEDVSSAFMERGTDMERRAVSFYELQRDLETTPAGFCLLDDRSAGASPDRFVGNDGLLEIKVPNAKTHVGYLLDETGDAYRLQRQGQLWICEREWVDFESYHPVMPSTITRQYRDEKVIAAIAAGVKRFNQMLADMKGTLQRRYDMFEGESFPVLQEAAR